MFTVDSRRPRQVEMGFRPSLRHKLSLNVGLGALKTDLVRRAGSVGAAASVR